MPISRQAFQIGISGDQEDVVEEVDVAPDYNKSASPDGEPTSIDGGAGKSGAEATGDSGLRIVRNAGAEESSQGDDRKESANLPPADPTSAEKKEAFGASHPERETRRSVATGRDVPQFTPDSSAAESTETNWEAARAQTEVYERRAQSQKSAAMEHLARIHDIVELLIEISEAQSNDGERKLQSLESKVAELEMRYAVNRTSP
jgi:hypothetical protein